MEEVEDQIKDPDTREHQLRVELVQIMADELSDLVRGEQAIEVEAVRPDQKVFTGLADQVGEMLEKKGQGRGIKEVTTTCFAGNPDLIVRWNAAKGTARPEADGVARQCGANVPRQIAPGPGVLARITDVRVRYSSDSFRFGPGRFDADFVRRQWIMLPPGRPRPPASRRPRRPR